MSAGMENLVQKPKLKLTHNVYEVAYRSIAKHYSFNLNSDLSKKNAWASQWKMTFNPGPNKQAQEVIFLVK